MSSLDTGSKIQRNWKVNSNHWANFSGEPRCQDAFGSLMPSLMEHETQIPGSSTTRFKCSAATQKWKKKQKQK